MPSTSRRSTLKSTPSTARTTPSSVRKLTWRLRTSSSGSLTALELQDVDGSANCLSGCRNGIPLVGQQLLENRDELDEERRLRRMAENADAPHLAFPLADPAADVDSERREQPAPHAIAVDTRRNTHDGDRGKPGRGVAQYLESERLEPGDQRVTAIPMAAFAVVHALLPGELEDFDQREDKWRGQCLMSPFLGCVRPQP